MVRGARSRRPRRIGARGCVAAAVCLQLARIVPLHWHLQLDPPHGVGQCWLWAAEGLAGAAAAGPLAVAGGMPPEGSTVEELPVDDAAKLRQLYGEPPGKFLKGKNGISHYVLD